jgi:hypothetical protein
VYTKVNAMYIVVSEIARGNGCFWDKMAGGNENFHDIVQ